MGEAKTAVERLRGALASEHFGPHQKRRLHFAFGKLLDSAEEFESAFDNYRAANGLYAESYDPGSHRKLEQNCCCMAATVSDN